MGLLRQLKPKRTSDLLFCVYALVLIHGVALHCLFTVLPWKQEVYDVTSIDVILYSVFLAFLYVNAIGNIWKIVTVNTTTARLVLPSIAPAGWYTISVTFGDVAAILVADLILPSTKSRQ